MAMKAYSASDSKHARCVRSISRENPTEPDPVDYSELSEAGKDACAPAINIVSAQIEQSHFDFGPEIHETVQDVY